MAWFRCIGSGGGSLKLRTATGNIANFETNLKSKLNSCKCTINPLQDLHGYTKPWSGGAGKNKVDFPSYAQASSNGLTIQTTGNGGFKVTGTPSASWAILTSQIDVNIPSGQAITFGITGGTLSHNVYLNLTYADSTTDTLLIHSGNTSKTMTLAKNLIKVRLDFSGMSTSTNYNDNFYPMLEYGSTQSAFEPYENICPISGFSGANIVRCGKNFLNGNAFADNLAGAAGYSKDTDNKTVKFTNSTTPPYHQVIFEVPFKANTQYTFIFNYTAVAPNRSLRIGYTDGTNSEVFFDTNGSKTSVVVNSLSGKTVKDLYLSFFSNGSTTIYYEEIGIFEGVVTLADFEPYNGQTATVNFGQTVYGGVLDVTNGKLTITHGIVDLGDLTWTYATDINRFYSNEQITIKHPASTSEIPYILCSHYQTLSWDNFQVASNDYCVSNPNANGRINIRDTQYTDATTFKTAMSGVQLVYELVTPTEITLTPKQIEALVGINNVFHDCNGETEVKYLVRE